MSLIIFLPIILMLNFNVFAMEQKKEVKTVSDLSWFCTQLAEKVSQEPEKSPTYEKYKVLYLNNYTDARICSILTQNTTKILGPKKAWNIKCFRCSSNFLPRSSEGLDRGIILNLYNSVDECSLDDLENTYKNIISSLQMNWKLARLEDHPTLKVKKNPEHWQLLIKKTDLIEEDTLIRFLTRKFHMKNIVLCNVSWHYKSHDEMYVLVKKDSQEQFDDIFGFQYQ